MNSDVSGRSSLTDIMKTLQGKNRSDHRHIGKQFNITGFTKGR